MTKQEVISDVITGLQPRYYVYFHVCQETNQVFYIGKGTNDRCNSTCQKSNEWWNIAKRTNMSFKVVKYENYLTEYEAMCLEMYCIKHYAHNGFLTNKVGKRWTDTEIRKRMPHNEVEYLVWYYNHNLNFYLEMSTNEKVTDLSFYERQYDTRRKLILKRFKELGLKKSLVTEIIDQHITTKAYNIYSDPLLDYKKPVIKSLEYNVD